MAVAATSPAAKAVDGARQLIAESPTFQTRVGAASKALALPSVYVGEVNAGEDTDDDTNVLADKRPFALVVLDKQGYVHIGQTTVVQLGVTGQVAVILSDTADYTSVSDGTDQQPDSEIDFLNFCDGVMADMHGLFGADTRYPFTGIELVQGPIRSDLTERPNDDFWLAVYLWKHGAQIRI